MHQIQSQNIYFSKISWGACPQTPLVAPCLACLVVCFTQNFCYIYMLTMKIGQTTSKYLPPALQWCLLLLFIHAQFVQWYTSKASWNFSVKLCHISTTKYTHMHTLTPLHTITLHTHYTAHTHTHYTAHTHTHHHTHMHTYTLHTHIRTTTHMHTHWLSHDSVHPHNWL